MIVIVNKIVCGGGEGKYNHFLTCTKNNVNSGYMHEMDLLISSHFNFTFHILQELATKKSVHSRSAYVNTFINPFILMRPPQDIS